jgi:hypothetical protein
VNELYITSGYIFTLGGVAISWMSYKQTILTRSTMEEKLVALDGLNYCRGTFAGNTYEL